MNYDLGVIFPFQECLHTFVCFFLFLQRLRTENRLLKQRIETLEKVSKLLFRQASVECTIYFSILNKGLRNLAHVSEVIVLTV